MNLSSSSHSTVAGTIDSPSNTTGVDFEERPTLPDAIGTADSAAVMSALGRFFVTGQTKGLQPTGEGCLPALLAPYRFASQVRTGYPLFISSKDGSETLECRPLAEQLGLWLDEAVPKNGVTSILRDNVSRIRRYIRKALQKKPGLADAQEWLATASKALVVELDLSKDYASALQNDIDAVLALVPKDSQLLGFAENTALCLLEAATRAALPARRMAFSVEIKTLIAQLDGLVRIELDKDGASRAPDALGKSFGSTSGASINMDALGALLGPHRGATRLDAERLQRIEAVLVNLRAYLAKENDAPVLSIVTHDQKLASSSQDVEIICEEAPCAAAASLFEKAAAEMAIIFRAVRTARLEVANAYQAAHHGPWLEAFGWQAFSLEELRLVRPVVALTSLDNLAGGELISLSRLLRSARPAKVIVTGHPAENPDTESALGSSVRLEVGYFGISHREAFVHETAVARPEHLLRGLCTGMASPHPSLHIVASTESLDGGKPLLGGWLHNGAAIEGRAHPLFSYDPEPGKTWAQRFDFDGNPQPELDWPLAPLNYRDSSGDQSQEIAFTFADFALLEKKYAGHFSQVPAGFENEKLVTLAQYLQLADEDAVGSVPFVWAVDAQNTLKRLVVTRYLAFACRDRASYWRTLQELAGVRNEYVRLAIEQAKQEAAAESEAKLAVLATSHAEELEAVRTGAAAESMGKLAAALLATDFTASLSGTPSSPAPVRASSSAPAPAQSEETEKAADAPKEAEVEEEETEEPWIESVLCTTCNDCLDVNPQMFVYDGNKQAVIKDSTAGTFEELVRAAEKCPARCIHPGQPLNKDEANLADLISRAEPFN